MQVTGRAGHRYLRDVGFYERQEEGWGPHLTDEEVRERGVITVVDVVRGARGLVLAGVIGRLVSSAATPYLDRLTSDPPGARAPVPEPGSPTLRSAEPSREPVP